MLTERIFEEVLIEPARRGRESLLIVSGYATASLADEHIETLTSFGSCPSISLLVGMAGMGGVVQAQHMAFCKLGERVSVDRFSCRYVKKGKSVHAKAFVWLEGKTPKEAFIGSANYTRRGMRSEQREVMACVDGTKVKDFYDLIFQDTYDCFDADVENFPSRSPGYGAPIHKGKGAPKKVVPTRQKVSLSLLTGEGEIHRRSGLNWGQREGRNTNQAYIPIPAPIQRSGFFPRRKERFIVSTDDEESFVFVVAQENGKALETPNDNGALGAYIRKRLGVASGTYVTKEHLRKYGRSDVRFTKIDDETYEMDFSPRGVGMGL